MAPVSPIDYASASRTVQILSHGITRTRGAFHPCQEKEGDFTCPFRFRTKLIEPYLCRYTLQSCASAWLVHGHMTHVGNTYNIPHILNIELYLHRRIQRRRLEGPKCSGGGKYKSTRIPETSSDFASLPPTK